MLNGQTCADRLTVVKRDVLWGADIDECYMNVGEDICEENMHCVNSPGSYECVPNKGFTRGFGKVRGIIIIIIIIINDICIAQVRKSQCN